MRTIWMSLLAAALLSACAGTPPEEQAGATVEDRTPGALKITWLSPWPGLRHSTKFYSATACNSSMRQPI